MRYINKEIVPTILAFFLVGCSTLITDSNPQSLAPENQIGQGQVAYNPHGLKELVDSRREDALAKIVKACGSNRYKIVKEEIKKVSEMSNAGLAGVGTDDLKVIHFECIK